MRYKGYLRGVKVINVTEGDIFFGGSGERSLFPSSGEGCPVGPGWLVPHKNHPVRVRLTPLQRRGMDLGPLQRGGFVLLCRLRGGMTRLLEIAL
jgi:hypothetical protein